MAEWLLDWRERDTAGPFWPMHVALRHYRDRSVDHPPASMVGWCHGSWGIAHALAVAGRALDRPDWTGAAREVILTVLVRCRPDWTMVRDNGLCHGWAGVLHQLCRLAWDDPDLDLVAAADDVAARLVAGFPAGDTVRLPRVVDVREEPAAGQRLGQHPDAVLTSIAGHRRFHQDHCESDVKLATRILGADMSGNAEEGSHD